MNDGPGEAEPSQVPQHEASDAVDEGEPTEVVEGEDGAAEVEEEAQVQDDREEKIADRFATMDDIQFDHITFGPKIGQGAFGEVNRGKLWGLDVALKQLRIKGDDDAMQKKIHEFQEEVKILRALRHPNIVQFLGACFQEPKMCLVTEYLDNGNLEDHMDKRRKAGKKMSFKRILKIAQDVARALNWLHHKGIIHRDLKTANILLDKNNNVKIADFGLAHIKSGVAHEGHYGVVGTPCYMAPEVLKEVPYGVKADVFSFAVVLCELVTGEYPFKEGTCPQSTNNFEKAIVEGLRPPMPIGCPPDLALLMQECWADNPESRPAMDDVVDRLEKIEKDFLAGTLTTHDLLDGLPDFVIQIVEDTRNRMFMLEAKLKQALHCADGEKRLREALQMRLRKFEPQAETERALPFGIWDVPPLPGPVEYFPKTPLLTPMHRGLRVTASPLPFSLGSPLRIPAPSPFTLAPLSLEAQASFALREQKETAGRSMTATCTVTLSSCPLPESASTSEDRGGRSSNGTAGSGSTEDDNESRRSRDRPRHVHWETKATPRATSADEEAEEQEQEQEQEQGEQDVEGEEGEGEGEQQQEEEHSEETEEEAASRHVSSDRGSPPLLSPRPAYPQAQSRLPLTPAGTSARPAASTPTATAQGHVHGRSLAAAHPQSHTHHVTRGIPGLLAPLPRRPPRARH